MAEKSQPKRKKLSARKSWNAEMEAGLSVIYGEESAEAAVVTKTPRNLKFILTRVFIALGALLVIVLGTAFWLTQDFFGHSQAPLELSIVAPAEAKGGEAVRLEVRYRNTDRRPLGNLDVDVNPPLGFVLDEAMPVPTDPAGLVWKFGSLGGSSDGVIVLTGHLWSESGSVVPVQALATYRPSSFNSDFSAVASAQIAIKDSILKGTWEGPSQAHAGEKVTYRLTVQNDGDQPIKGASVELAPPVAFKLAMSTPAVSLDDQNNITLPDLDVGAKAVVELIGSYAADEAGPQPMKASLRLPDPKDTTKQITAWSGEFATELLQSDLMVTLVGNGSSDLAEVAPGKMLRLSVKVENRSATLAKAPQLILDVQPDSGVPIIWKDVELDGGRTTAQGISFSGTGFPDLAAKGSKAWALSLPISPSLLAGGVDQFTITPRLKSGAITIEGVPLKVAITGDIKAEAVYRYFDASGKTVGEGAWPPKSGAVTTLDATVTIAPTGHALKNIDGLIPLAANVTFGEALDAAGGTLTYDESDRSIHYRRDGEVPEGSRVTIHFTIKVAPDASNVGGYMRLVRAGSVRARDAITDALLVTGLPEVTTELPADSAAAGTGAITN